MVTEVFHNILIGLSLILGTFMLHAIVLDRLIYVLTYILPFTKSEKSRHRHFWKTLVLMISGTGIIFLHSAEIWLWAFLYLFLDIPVIHDLESALYFSATSFSTLGYGDVVLPPDTRLLGTIQGTSGLILFGWSTAFMFEIIAATYNRLNIRAMRDS